MRIDLALDEANGGDYGPINALLPDVSEEELFRALS